MLKRFLIVCICLVAVIAVFGLNDHLTYDGFQTAFESIEGDSAVIKDDLAVVEILAEVVKRFAPSNTVQIDSDESGGKFYVVLRVIPHASNPDYADLVYARRWEVNDKATAVQLRQALTPLQWGGGNPYNGGIFTDVLSGLSTIAFFLGALISIILSLFIILFDVVGVAWSVVTAFLYLVGLSTSP